jgi:tRNA modification GTPase
MHCKNIDTSQPIFSLASGSLPSAVAIVKLSGKDSFQIAKKLFFQSEPFEEKRNILHGELRSLKGDLIDQIVLLTFVAPHSHTGENVIEFHCHGSKTIVESLSSNLIELGARPAEKGEFSYRAFLNGKMSARELDTLADVFLSQDQKDLKDIYSRENNSIRFPIDKIRELLIKTQAILDTSIDFTEEYSEVVSQAFAPLELAIHDSSVVIQRYEALKKGKNTPRIVIAGRPNSGKSSLFNSILCHDRSIVHNEAGTTRDVVEEEILLNNKPWKLVDTAGIRNNVVGPEAIGIEYSEKYLSVSQFWLLVIDGTVGLQKEDDILLSKYKTIPHLILWNKKDDPKYHTPPPPLRENVLEISAMNNDGLDLLLKELNLRCVIETGYSEFLPTAQQTAKLKFFFEEASQFKKDLEAQELPEYLSEKNRKLINILEGVISEIDPEQVLDRVFNEFCIGK